VKLLICQGKFKFFYVFLWILCRFCIFRVSPHEQNHTAIKLTLLVYSTWSSQTWIFLWISAIFCRSSSYHEPLFEESRQNQSASMYLLQPNIRCELPINKGCCHTATLLALFGNNLDYGICSDAGGNDRNLGLVKVEELIMLSLEIR